MQICGLVLGVEFVYSFPTLRFAAFLDNALVIAYRTPTHFVASLMLPPESLDRVRLAVLLLFPLIWIYVTLLTGAFIIVWAITHRIRRYPTVGIMSEVSAPRGTGILTRRAD
jgi:hypothetical protein